MELRKSAMRRVSCAVKRGNMSNIEKLNQFVLGESRRSEPFRMDAKRQAVKKVGQKPGSKVKTGSVLSLPIHYESGYAYPLLVWFHSPGADETELFEVMPKISLRNFVAAAPRGLTSQETGRSSASRFRHVEGCVGRFAPLYDWNEDSQVIDEAETRFFEAVEHAKASCRIAPNRIFLAGIGAGGSMAMRIGARYPDRVAGVLSFSGAFPLTPFSLARWGALRQLPMMMMVGSKNPVFSPSAVSEQLRLFHTAGMSVSIRQYKTADEATPTMFKDANQWMMERILNPQV